LAGHGPRLSQLLLAKLIGRLVVAIVNPGLKHIGPETSEVLVLGLTNSQSETINVTPESDVPIGTLIF
jgi:hypothetical protein